MGINLKIEQIIAEENIVAVRYTETGIFRAYFLGQEPTGLSYELVAIEWFEIAEGKIKKRWGARDFAAQARQIGLSLS